MYSKAEWKSIFLGGAGFLLFLLVLFPAGIFFLPPPNLSKTEPVSLTPLQQSAAMAAGEVKKILEEDVSLWQRILRDVIPPIYQGNQEFPLYSAEGALSGSYRVWLSSTADNPYWGEMKIVFTGQNKEQAGLRAIYSRETIPAAFVSLADIELNDIVVHWGPLWTAADIIAGNELFPRKFASGNILNRDTNGVSLPNSDGQGWWSYYSPLDFPELDIDFYANQARGQGNYYPKDMILENLLNRQENTYLYFAQDLVLRGKIDFRGILIVEGDLSLQGAGEGDYPLRVPRLAAQEYLKVDTTASAEYPGDLGLCRVSDFYETPEKTKIALSGLVYVGGNLWTKGNQNIYGVLLVRGKTIVSGNLTIFFDDSQKISLRHPWLKVIHQEYFEPNS